MNAPASPEGMSRMRSECGSAFGLTSDPKGPSEVPRLCQCGPLPRTDVSPRADRHSQDGQGATCYETEEPRPLRAGFLFNLSCNVSYFSSVIFLMSVNLLVVMR